MKSMVSNICSDFVRRVVAALCAMVPCMVCAQTAESVPVLRPVTATYTVEAGSSHLADTYLTPLKYSGWSLALAYERRQAMRFDPQRWVMRLAVSARAERAVNVSGNASMWYWGIDGSWGMTRRLQLTPDLSVGYGGSVSATLGCVYSARNGNNPASARAALTFDGTGYVAYRTALAGVPVLLRYQPTLPVTGVFFSPDYGELYYEIYLGNRSGLAHCAWWGNYFSLDNLLTADLQLGTTALRLGYRFDFCTTRVNNITTRMFSHRAVVGITGEWISLRSGKKVDPLARIISANY